MSRRRFSTQKAMRVAAIQAAPVFLDSAATTDKALDFLHRAASGGAELIAFPEVFIAGYPFWLRSPSIAVDDSRLKTGNIAYLNSAITASGPELAAIGSEASQLGVFVYVGFLERAGSCGSAYASLAAIHPDKGIVGVHRKLKPTFRERLIWSDGDGHGLEVHNFKDLRVGALNCYENWLPLARHALQMQGEQLHIAAWPGDLVVTEHISQYIAMEGRVYVISASGLLRTTDIPSAFPLREHAVTDRCVINEGGSMIVAPSGSIIAGPIIGEETILYADADVDVVVGERLKLDPAGHCSRHDVLRMTVNKARYDLGS